MTPAPPPRADDLRSIPGVGPSLAADLRLLGIDKVADLRGRDPQRLYAELEESVGHHVDRCVLYVFRSSVYFAEQAEPELELTKWWSWKDGGPAEARGLTRRGRPQPAPAPGAGSPPRRAR